MITNNLFMKLKERDDENIAKVKEILLSMKGKIDELQDIRVEVDIRHGATSYDIMMIAQYNTEEDLNAYTVHPVHKEVVKNLEDYKESGVSVCYES